MKKYFSGGVDLAVYPVISKKENKMKKMFFGLVGLFFLIGGCSIAVSPVVNSVELTNLDFSDASNLKKSKSCATYLLGLIGPFGDAQVINAVREGNIKKVYSVDYENGFYLLFSQNCVVVYGE